MSCEVNQVTYTLLGIFFLGTVVFEIINYRKNRKTLRLRNNEWKYTKIAQNVIPIPFVICLFPDMFIAGSSELVHTILFYTLWFSFGLLLGSLLMKYVIRKDMDNIRKQIEQREKNAEKSESKSGI